MKTKRVVGGLLGGLLVASGGAYALRSEGASASAAPGAAAPAPEVQVAEVAARPLAETAEFTGSLTAPESVELRARVGGYVERVLLPEGQAVRRGQVLFELDARPAQAALARARADLQLAESTLVLARRALARAEQLLEGRVIPQSEHDALTTQHAEAQARVQAARAAVRLAELEVGYTKVKAPVDGRVGRALVTQGNLVTPGTVLTTLVSVDPLHVSFDVDEPTFRRLAGGRTQDVRVHVGLAADAGFPREARLDFVSNQLERTSGTARVRAVLPNPDGTLAPGLFARVRLSLGKEAPTPVVQDLAVGTDAQGRFVLVVRPDNSVEYRPVALGSATGGLRAVRTGLTPGERVVLKGMARPGMTVTPKLVAAAAEGR